MGNTEEYNMPMTAIEASRAMEWATANGHTDREARGLVDYIVDRGPIKVEREEEKEETKE